MCVIWFWNVVNWRLISVTSSDVELDLILIRFTEKDYMDVNHFLFK